MLELRSRRWCRLMMAATWARWTSVCGAARRPLRLVPAPWWAVVGGAAFQSFAIGLTTDTDSRCGNRAEVWIPKGRPGRTSPDHHQDHNPAVARQHAARWSTSRYRGVTVACPSAPSCPATAIMVALPHTGEVTEITRLRAARGNGERLAGRCVRARVPRRRAAPGWKVRDLLEHADGGPSGATCRDRTGKPRPSTHREHARLLTTAPDRDLLDLVAVPGNTTAVPFAGMAHRPGPHAASSHRRPGTRPAPRQADPDEACSGQPGPAGPIRWAGGLSRRGGLTRMLEPEPVTVAEAALHLEVVLDGL
jgi:hypothetical protein